VEAQGCELIYLPPYSPDFSPIEEAFSKLKTLLRKVKARTRVSLVEAIGLALSAITAQDAAGYFGHCGYPLDAQPL
jgi:transposase